MSTSVVVGVDGSGRSLRAVIWAAHDAALRGLSLRLVHSLPSEYAFEEASLRKARLRVASAVGLPQGWPRHLLRPLPEDDAEVADRRATIEEQLVPLREQFPGVDVEVHVHRRDVVPVLTDASHKADLLVMGSRGRGGFHGLAVGSVTHKLMHFAGCPLMIIHRES